MNWREEETGVVRIAYCQQPTPPEPFIDLKSTVKKNYLCLRKKNLVLEILLKRV